MNKKEIAALAVSVGLLLSILVIGILYSDKSDRRYEVIKECYEAEEHREICSFYFPMYRY